MSKHEIDRAQNNVTFFTIFPGGWTGVHHGRTMQFSEDLAFIFELGDRRPMFVGPASRARTLLQEPSLFERLALARHKSTAPHVVAKARSAVRLLTFPPTPAGSRLLHSTLHRLMLDDWMSLDDHGALTVAEVTTQSVVRVGQNLSQFLAALKSSM